MRQCPRGPVEQHFRVAAGPGSGTTAALASDPLNAPFLHIRWKNGSATCRGTGSHFEGYRLRDPSRGVFASWNWDGDRLDVDCSWGGFRPLFYACSGDEFWVSPSISVLLREGVPAELDYAALGILTGWNCAVGDRTIFRSVRAVPRSGRLRWSRGRLEAEDRIPPATGASLPRDRFVDAFIEAVRASVRRHVEVCPAGPWLVPLSAGRDSRFLLLELVRQGVGPITCLTTDRVEVFAGEGPIAAEIARRCGVEHYMVQRAMPSISSLLETLRLTQLHAPEHVWLLDLATRAGRHPGVLLDGIGTDSLMEPNEPIIPEFRRLCEEDRLGEIVACLRRTGPWVALRRTVRQSEWDCEGRQLLTDELRRHAEAPNPTGSFQFWNLTRRTVAWSPFSLLSRSNPVFAPYLDRDVVSLVYAMPADTLLKSDLRAMAIQRAFPEFSDIPFESTVPPPRDLYPWRVRACMATGLMRRLVEAPPSELLDNGWLWPRLARSVLDPSYRSLEWFAVPVLRTLLMESWMQRRRDDYRPCDGAGNPG